MAARPRVIRRNGLERSTLPTHQDGPEQRLSADVIKPTREYSRKQEDRVAHELGGYRTANSGATPFSKGDVSAYDVLVECKTSTVARKSVRILKEWLTKLKEETYGMRKKRYALVFDFGDGEDYAIVPLSQLRLYEESLREAQYNVGEGQT